MSAPWGRSRVTVLVSSRVAEVLPVVEAWARSGDTVTIVLLDGAAASARPGHADAPALKALGDAGAVLAAHDDALRRRALPLGSLVEGVKAVDLDEVADLITTGADRAVWW